jgi:hypothetical protein
MKLADQRRCAGQQWQFVDSGGGFLPGTGAAFRQGAGPPRRSGPDTVRLRSCSSFAPQNLWYLVYQIGPPTFSTSTNLADPAVMVGAPDVHRHRTADRHPEQGVRVRGSTSGLPARPPTASCSSVTTTATSQQRPRKPDHLLRPTRPWPSKDSRRVIPVPVEFFLNGWVDALSDGEIITYLALHLMAHAFPDRHKDGGVFLTQAERLESFNLDRGFEAHRMLSRYGLIDTIRDRRRNADGTMADFGEVGAGQIHRFKLDDCMLAQPAIPWRRATRPRRST